MIQTIVQCLIKTTARYEDKNSLFWSILYVYELISNKKIISIQNVIIQHYETHTFVLNNVSDISQFFFASLKCIAYHQISYV